MQSSNVNTEVNMEEVLDEKLVTEMIQAGVLYSHKKSKANPKMRPFISANRHDIDILDVRAVVESIESATTFLKEMFTRGGLVLFIGVTPPSSGIIEDTAKKFNQPYVTHRWIGGTLTNFEVIRKRVNHYIELKEKQAKGELEKYTKKERMKFADEIAKLSQHCEGLVKLERLPDTLFVVNSEVHMTAVKEANITGIPVVAVIDSNDDPERITHPIIANDHTRSSVAWVMNRVIDELRTVQNVRKKLENKEEAESNKEDEREDKK